MQKYMTGTGIEFKLLFIGIKYIAICMFVWFIEPIFGFVITQVDNVALLTPFVKSFLEDVKIIFSVLIPILLAVKYMYEILKIKENKQK